MDGYCLSCSEWSDELDWECVCLRCNEQHDHLWGPGDPSSGDDLLDADSFFKTSTRRK